MRTILAFILICAVGCGTATAAAPIIPETRHWELQELPPDAETEEIEGYGGEDWAEGLEAGECVDADGKLVEGASKPCPDRSGISVSERRAARLDLYATRYKELRKIALADRKIAQVQREYYEARMQAALKEIERLQPSWWERHDGEILGLAGFALGAATVVILAMALDDALADNPQPSQ